jgi:tetratricopeptide (TPR) repeat protein
VRRLRDEIFSDALTPGEQLGAACNVLGYDILTADFPNGTRLFTLIDGPVQREDVGPLRRLNAMGWLGFWRLKCGDYAEALPYFDRAIVLAELYNASAQALYLGSYRALTLCHADRRDEAKALLEDIESKSDPRDQLLAGTMAFVRTEYETRMGRFPQAAQQLDTAIECFGQANFRVEMDRCGIFRAAGYTELNRLQEARSELDQSWRPNDGTILRNLAAFALIVESEICFRSGEEGSALALLNQGLALAANPLQAAPLLYLRHWLPRLFAIALQQRFEVETVRRLIKKWNIVPENLTDTRWPWPVKICMLGRFEILLDGAPPEFARKPPARLLSLLKAIVAFGGTDVPEQRLIDAIWPEDEGDAGARSLNVAITRLRKLLDCPDAIEVSDGKISLDQKRCWVDAFVFEQAAERLPRSAEQALDHASLIAAASTVDLYRGNFLSADEGAMDDSDARAFAQQTRGSDQRIGPALRVSARVGAGGAILPTRYRCRLSVRASTHRLDALLHLHRSQGRGVVCVPSIARHPFCCAEHYAILGHRSTRSDDFLIR